MKPVNFEINSFQDLIKGEYLYIDKTEYIYTLISQPIGLYLITRPPHFGKTLLLSTLRSYFLGDRDLFINLALYDKPVSWDKHPLIQIDLSDLHIDSAESLEEKLCNQVDEQAKNLEVSLSGSDSGSKLLELITSLSCGSRKVVLLIDEYDRPVLDNIESPFIAEILKILNAFLAVIKSAEPYLRFVLVTGVSKLSLDSLYSNLDLTEDLTRNSDYRAALGYTQTELETYFSGYIDEMAKERRRRRDPAQKRIQDWYDGYRFSEDAQTVYNPVSVGRCLGEQKFSNSYINTDTPLRLLRLMQKYDYDLIQILEEPVTELAFSPMEIQKPSITSLLIQTGYLSISDTYDEGNILFFKLSFPNYEMQEAFSTNLIDTYCHLRSEWIWLHLQQLASHLMSQDFISFFHVLRTFSIREEYASSPDIEKIYKTTLYLILRSLNLHTTAEVRTDSLGITTIINTDYDIIILEFGMSGTAPEAAEYIDENGYTDAYLEEGKTITTVGAAYDYEKRTCWEWKVGRSWKPEKIKAK